jgi:hypothetical protein
MGYPGYADVGFLPFTNALMEIIMLNLSSWDEELSPDQSIEILCDLALAHCRLAGKQADGLAHLIVSRDFKSVCAYELDYCAGYTVNTVLHMRQALAFFTKLENLDIGVDKEAVARNNFYKSELECLRTNRLFNMTASDDFCFTSDVRRVLKRAERKIAAVLGPVPSIFSLDLSFGPGATTSVPKRNACAREKLSAVPSCSINLLPLIPLLYEELPHYFGLHEIPISQELNLADWDLTEVSDLPLELSDGRISFVPKNAKTFRTVMTEPTLNALVQSGFGKFISRRLCSIGQNPRDQSRNQVLAREGSLTGALATLDLSMASDSISSEFVASLLPYEWFSALSLCRTPTVFDNGKVIHLHKFSSMGNGFTFPLQTLIFWALAEASVHYSDSPDSRVSVYGDDIIIGVDAVPLMKTVLKSTGFSLNTEKSYWSGPFRESCGKDYYFGFDIRPFYARDWISGEFLFLLHNFYFRNCEFDLASKVLGFIPSHLRIFGPDGYGDGHLLRDGCCRPHRRDRGYGGYVFDTYVKRGRKHMRYMPGDRVLPVYTAYVREGASSLDDILSSGDLSRSLDESTTPHIVDRKGRDVACCTLPGTAGYKRISVYTLTP